MENSGKPAAFVFCYRSGCTRLEDITPKGSNLPGNLQRSVPVPCPQPAKVEPVSIWVAEARCGTARDCVPSNSYYQSKEQAVAASAPWIARGGGRTALVRPLRAGEQIAY